jgi:hypothetical protein
LEKYKKCSATKQLGKNLLFWKPDTKHKNCRWLLIKSVSELAISKSPDDQLAFFAQEGTLGGTLTGGTPAKFDPADVSSRKRAPPSRQVSLTTSTIKKIRIDLDTKMDTTTPSPRLAASTDTEMLTPSPQLTTTGAETTMMESTTTKMPSLIPCPGITYASIKESTRIHDIEKVLKGFMHSCAEGVRLNASFLGRKTNNAKANTTHKMSDIHRPLYSN